MFCSPNVPSSSADKGHGLWVRVSNVEKKKEKSESPLFQTAGSLNIPWSLYKKSLAQEMHIIGPYNSSNQVNNGWLSSFDVEDFPDMWERFTIASVKSYNLDDKLLSVSKRKGLFFLNVFFGGIKYKVRF